MKEMILAGQHTIYPLGLIHPFACCGAISTNCTALGVPHSGRTRHCHLLTSVLQHLCTEMYRCSSVLRAPLCSIFQYKEEKTGS